MTNRQTWQAAEAAAAERRAVRLAAVAESERTALTARAERAEAAAVEAERQVSLSPAERQAEAEAERQTFLSERAEREAAEAERVRLAAVDALAAWQASPAAERAVTVCPVPVVAVLERDGREAAAVRMTAPVRAARPVAAVSVPAVAAEMPRDYRTDAARHGRASMRRPDYTGYRKAVDTADGTSAAFLVTRAGVRVVFVCGHGPLGVCGPCRSAVAEAAVAADKVRANGREWRAARKVLTASRVAERAAWQAVERLTAFLPAARVGGRGREAVAALEAALAEADALAAVTLAALAESERLAAADAESREVVNMPTAEDDASPTLATLARHGAA